MKDGVTILAVLALLLLTGATGKRRAPVRGRISSKFGDRGGYFHNGIDIAVGVGTKVKVPMAGTVAKIYTTASGGKQMIVNHANGFTSGYAHLNKVYFGKGAKVKKGKVIALTGRTGNVTGAHLHFSWRKDGKYLDPKKHFKF